MRELAMQAAVMWATFKNDERGMTSVEYALVAGCLAMALISVLLVLGNDINALFAPAAS